MTLYTDASAYGWGAWFQGVPSQGKFSPQEQSLCINSKETLAMYYGVVSFQPFFTGSHLLICSDNTTALAFARDMGEHVFPH